MRTSTGDLARAPPIGRTAFSWITRSSFTCMCSGSSATSSRNSVPPLRGLEQAVLVGVRAGEAALLVAEEFALHQFGRNRAAVDRHERTAGARALLVDQARDELLADAGFAADVDRRLAARELADGARADPASPANRRSGVAAASRSGRSPAFPRRACSAVCTSRRSMLMSTGLETKSNAPALSALTAASTLP